MEVIWFIGISLLVYVIYVIVSLKLIPEVWEQDGEIFWGLILFFMPMFILIPIINIIPWSLMIIGLFEEINKKKTKGKNKIKEQFNDIEKFAHNFNTYINGKEELSAIQNLYYNCYGKILLLKSNKYKDIHIMHNKKSERLFLKTIGLIKECYDNNSLLECKDDVIIALTTLEGALKSELESYEKENNEIMKSVKNQFVSSFSKLSEEIRNAKDLSNM